MLGLVEALRLVWGPDHFTPVAPTEEHVPFRSRAGAGVRPLVDVYLPDATRATGASVLLVHGGGFVIGSRRMKPMRYLAAELVRAGVAVCAVDYRLIFRGGRLEEAVDDVHTAFGFWRERAVSAGLDPQRVSVVGLSAGAALALYVASREPAVHRLACCFGVYELDALHGVLGRVIPPLLFRTRDRRDWHARSPSSVAQPSAPTLLLHGSHDRLVSHVQAERLAAHREALGLPTRLVVYPGAPHGFFSTASRAAEEGVQELLRHVG